MSHLLVNASPVVPDSAAVDLTAQQAAGDTELVTPAQQAAAALAAAGAPSTGTMTTLTVADYTDGDHFTIPDGTHSVKFEPRAKAESTIELIDLADIADNDTLLVDDGTNDPVTFEAQVTAEPTYSTGSITCVAPANLKNNESCSIGVGNVFAFNVEAAAPAVGSLTFAAKADCTDGDTFTLYGQVFEVDKTGDGAAGTNIAVDISDAGVVTASEVADVAKTAITAEFGVETVTAGTITDGVLALESVDESYAANVEITVTGTSCTATGMAGGATEFSAGEATEVDLTTAEDLADVADTLGATIDLASIGVTAGVPVDGVIPLTSDIPGPIEIEIIDAVADAGFTHENIAGGLAFSPTPDTTLLDFTECATESDKVEVVVDAINAATTAEDLDLVATDAGDGATFTVTNTALASKTMTFTGELVDGVDVVSAGLGAAAVEGAVVVDMTGLTTATQGAAKICQVANALGAAALNVTCVPSAGDIAVTNNANGTAGNVSITENVADAGFTVSGMTGGRNPLASRTLDDVPDSAARFAVSAAGSQAVAALAPLELKCANAFDPSVTGLAAGIGARCTTIDLTKCWIKYGTGDTQWGPTHAITGTFGENVATWDTTALIADLACNTLGGFKIVFDPIVMTSGATQVVVLRINGARLIDNAVGNAYLTSIPWATPAPVCYKKARLAETGNDGTWLNLTLTCEHARSGSSPWVIESEAIFRHSETYPAIRTRATVWSLEAPPLAEINSVGLAVTNDSYSPEGTMGAASRATITRI